jgi:hypothetical protein
MHRISKHLTPSHVIAAIALFLAMSGAAVAGGKVARNSVTSASIKNGSVTGRDVKNDSLTGADIDEASLALARATAGQQPAGRAGGDLIGQYPNPRLGPATVHTGKLADDAVTSAKLANDAVTDTKIADGAVGDADLADDAVTTSKIAPGNVTSEDISGNAVGARALADTHFYQTTATIPAQSSRNVQVRCGGSNELAISGGGYFSDANDSFVNVWVVGSAPSFNGDAWNVRAANPGQTARSFTAVVHCLPA